MVSSRELIAARCICCDSTHLQRSPAVLMPFVALRVFGHEPVQITEEWGLRDLHLGMAYTLCNSLQCLECGALFLDYRFTDEQMVSLYSNYRDDRYYSERDRFEPGFAQNRQHFEHRAQYLSEVEAWLKPHLPTLPAVLDWGGDTGINSLFRDNNRLLHIYDISGVELVSGAKAVDSKGLVDTRYDVITCCQMLEHVPFPHLSIEQMLPAMGDQTLMYLEVPHEALVRAYPDALDLAPRKRHWHEHVNFFSEQSLRRLLARYELSVVDVLYLPVDVGWSRGEVLGVLAKRGAQ